MRFCTLLLMLLAPVGYTQDYRPPVTPAPAGQVVLDSAYAWVPGERAPTDSTGSAGRAGPAYVKPQVSDEGIVFDWTVREVASGPVEQAAANAVEILFPVNAQSSNKGSGVYLGERLVATAYHVPRGTSGNGTVTFRDGTRANCKVIQMDRLWDQCIVELDREHPTLPGVEIADRNPQAGETVYSVGFAVGFRIFGGRMTGQWAGPGGTSENDWFDHENAAIPGDSGGPVFNETGKLIGCLWGSDGRRTTACGTGRFTVFVKPLFPRLAQWRANRIGRQISGIGYSQCPPGGCQPSAPGYSPGGGVATYPGNGQPTQPPPLELTPSHPLPTPGPACNCDQEQIIAAVIEKLASDERFRGPAGPAGPAGAAGRDGVDGEVTTAHLAAITESLLTAIGNDDRFRGPKGDRGDRGPAGEVASIDVDRLTQQILSQVKHPGQRVVLVDGKNGKIIDDETYAPGEPIVLDFQQILRSAGK